LFRRRDRRTGLEIDENAHTPELFDAKDRTDLASWKARRIALNLAAAASISMVWRSSSAG
jgi:hypothetical protein